VKVIFTPLAQRQLEKLYNDIAGVERFPQLKPPLEAALYKCFDGLIRSCRMRSTRTVLPSTR
jgi:hypothetical protein